MEKPWRPLSVRDSVETDEYEALDPGVPVWLTSTLRGWVKSLLLVPYATGKAAVSEDRLQAIERAARLDIFNMGQQDKFHAQANLLNLATREPARFLDAVDFMLATYASEAQAEKLERYLEAGGSLWRVVGHGSRFRLERRVEATTADAFETASRAGRAGQMLRRAWHAAYGRDPDPSTAYRDAVRAVEAAGRPVILPNDDLATLGKMNGTIRATPHRFTFAMTPSGGEGIEKVLGMMELLWEAQHDCHGDADEDKPRNVEQAEAEAAVLLAVTLVQWFNSGAVGVV
jgi:hypothetical protein